MDICRQSVGRLNIKMLSYQGNHFHHENRKVSWLSCLYSCNPFTLKMFLYCNRPLYSFGFNTAMTMTEDNSDIELRKYILHLHICPLHISYHYTVWQHYNMVNILENPDNGHLIVRSLQQDVGCLLWIQTLSYACVTALLYEISCYIGPHFKPHTTGYAILQFVFKTIC